MNANLQLRDLDVRHQVGLLRLGAATSRKAVALINRAEADVLGKLEKGGVGDVTRASARATRLEKLLGTIRATQREAYTALTRAVRTDLIDLGEYEGEFQVKAMQAVLAPTRRRALKPPPIEVLRAAVDSRPFQGRVLKEWGRDLDEAAFRRIRDAIRIGFVEGESVTTIARRIRGTSGARFKDGITEISRRGAEGLVRTAVNHMATTAREAFYERNSDLFRGVRWSSILDARTTAVCRVRDGTVYPINKGPRPPAHWNCRSSIVPVLVGEPDAPETETYVEWLKRQDVAMQDDILGKAKGALFRRGGLPLDRFVDRSGKEYTLAQLREREAAAFERAGLAA